MNNVVKGVIRLKPITPAIFFVFSICYAEVIISSASPQKNLSADLRDRMENLGFDISSAVAQNDLDSSLVEAFPLPT